MQTILFGGIGLLVILLIFKFSKKGNSKNKNSKRAEESNLNEFYKTKTDTFKAAQKAGFVSKEIRIKSNNSNLVVPNIGPYDGLIGWAAYIIATGEDSSTSHIQRLMLINSDRAYNITRSLIELGVLKENGTKQHTVMIRDLKRLKELLDKQSK